MNVRQKFLLSALFFSSIVHVQASRAESPDSLRADTSNIRQINLDEFVVTSFRYNRNIHNISAPFQIIGKSSIDISDIGDIAAVLNHAPGVQMQSGTFQTTKITIRGIGSRSPYGTNRTRAYLDDIPLTTGDGNTVVDDIELTFIDKIEITKGPYSSWHGSGMGGSVRFVSLRDFSKAFSVEAGVSMGSFGLKKYSGNVRLAKPAGFFNAGLAHITGDGYRQNSSFSRNSVFISGENRKSSKLNYLLIYSGVKSFTPSSVDEQTFLNSPWMAASNWLNVNGRKDYERLLGGVRLESRVGRALRNIATLSAGIYDQYELRPFNILDDRAMSFNLHENLMYSRTEFSVSAGFEWLHENYFWKILENTTLHENQKSVEARNQINTWMSFETTVLPPFILSCSGNLNATRYSVTDLFIIDNTDFSGKYTNRLIFSPKVGIVYRHNTKVSFYASAGHGFSNPTAEESLTSQGFLNTELRPEQGWTFDTGVRGSVFENTLNYEAAAYYILLNDLLVTKRISEEVFFGENAGKSTLKGIELQLKYKPVSYFQVLLSAGKSENRFREFISDNKNFSNNYLPGIPATNVKIDLQTALFRNLQLNAMYTYTGKQFLNDENNLQANAWQMLNLRSAYSTELFGKYRLQIIANINNLFDEKYASMILVNAPSFANRPPRYYYPALPRNLLFTVKFGFL